MLGLFADWCNFYFPHQQARILPGMPQTKRILPPKGIADGLKQKLKESSLEEELRTRLHRAISWLNCAEMQAEELDLRFLSLWISFNSCYAIELTEAESKTERVKFKQFISSLVKHDTEGKIFNLLWEKFSGPVRLLIKNKFIFKPFWDYQRGEIQDWETAFDKANTDATSYLSAYKIDGLLHIILDRLYVLRNQLFHGGATFRSKVNRDQVKDGAAILGLLLPIMIDIIMNHPEEDWGRLMFPVVKED